MLSFRNNAVAVALVFGRELVPISISDCEQLVVFGGRGVALALKFKLNVSAKHSMGNSLEGSVPCIAIFLPANECLASSFTYASI